MQRFDKKMLSDTDVDDLLKSARDVLGNEPGETVAGHTAISAARQALHLLSLGLIAAGLKRET